MISNNQKYFATRTWFLFSGVVLMIAGVTRLDQNANDWWAVAVMLVALITVCIAANDIMNHGDKILGRKPPTPETSEDDPL